jgi:hypothetical protein
LEPLGSRSGGRRHARECLNLAVGNRANGIQWQCENLSERRDIPIFEVRHVVGFARRSRHTGLPHGGLTAAREEIEEGQVGVHVERSPVTSYPLMTAEADRSDLLFP